MSFENERLKELGMFPPKTRLKTEWLENDKIKVSLYGNINNSRYAVQIDYLNINDYDYQEFNNYLEAIEKYENIKKGL